MTLTISILTKNNAATLVKTLESILPLEAEIIIADMQSVDETKKIGRKYGANIKDVTINGDYSYVRNSLLENKDGWRLHIEPWEVLASGHDVINDIVVENNPSVFYTKTFYTDNIITKNTRLWHKESSVVYQNPVYETLPLKGEMLDTVTFFCNDDKREIADAQEIIQEWLKNSPIAIEPYYYQAYHLMSQKRHKEFLSAVDLYTNRNPKGISATMMRYYAASVRFNVFKETKTSTRDILACIAANPTMAEFWCLLADIYYSKNYFQKAESLYENAIILGQQRHNTDLWPIDIDKYKDYPEQMIKSCKEIMQHKKFYKRSS